MYNTLKINALLNGENMKNSKLLKVRERLALKIILMNIVFAGYIVFYLVHSSVDDAGFVVSILLVSNVVLNCMLIKCLIKINYKIKGNK